MFDSLFPVASLISGVRWYGLAKSRLFVRVKPELFYEFQFYQRFSHYLNIYLDFITHGSLSIT